MKHDTHVSYTVPISKCRLAVMMVLAVTLSNPLGGMAADAPASGKPASSPKPVQAPQPAPGTPAYTLADGAEIGPAMSLTIGKSTLLRLPAPIDRVSVGNPNVADVTLISPRELYFLGKTVGATNVILWRRGGNTTIIDVTVNLDASRLQERINELLPGEKNIKVTSAAESVVLSGEVSSAVKADQVVSIAEAYVRNLNHGMQLPVVAGGGQVAAGTTIKVSETRGGGGGGSAVTVSRVVNMLRVTSPQQVMLEVKVAEVSKNLLDKLGASVGARGSSGNWTYSILSSLLSGGAGLLSAIKSPNNFLQIDGEKEDGLVKILAEPNIIAVSGQEGSFLAGGKIFIPVARANAINGLATITLEEKEFGVGLKFTPTVLDGDRINLRVAPEVSELNQRGSPFTAIDGTTTILPSFTTRRAQTTVQLNDGQSFAIAGLIKNNVTESMNRFPGLGEIPILGALFRSTEFQHDRTELMFIITPRLVKPLPPNYALPTDSFVPPTRGEYLIEGKMEAGSGGGEPAGEPARSPAAPDRQPRAIPADPAKGGFDTK